MDKPTNVKVLEVERIILDLDISLGIDEYLVQRILSEYETKSYRCEYNNFNKFRVSNSKYNICDICITEVVIGENNPTYYLHEYFDKDRFEKSIILSPYVAIYPYVYSNKAKLDEYIFSDYMIFILDNIKNIASKGIDEEASDNARYKYYITDNTQIMFQTLINVGSYEYNMKSKNIDFDNKYINIELSDKLEEIKYDISRDGSRDIMIDYVIKSDDIFTLKDDYRSIIRKTFGIDQ